MSKVELIKRLCEEKGISVNALEKELGFSGGSISKMDTNKPNAKKLYDIASYFGIPMEIFFDERADLETLQKFKQLASWSDAVKKCFGSEEEFKEFSDELEKFGTEQPLYETAAGQGRINGAYACETIKCDTEEEGYVWCKVCGDSMFPDLFDGDIVKVRLQTTDITAQDLTVIKVDGESATIKHVEITDNGVWLRAVNKDVFKDTFYSVQDVLSLPVTIVGKVVELRRQL